MKKEVSNKFKYFNFIFTLLIVLYHFRFKTGLNIYPKSGIDTLMFTSFLSIIENSVFLAMTVFFMISAFLFYFNIDKPKDTLNKMKKRIKTLLIPYLSWTIVSILFKILVIHQTPINSPYSVIKCLFLDPADGPLWYILALLIFMLPAPLIVKLKNKKLLSIISLLFVLIIVELREFGYISTLIKIDDWWWHGNMLGYIPAYAIGTYLGLTYSEAIIQEKYNNRITSIIGIIMMIVSIVLIKHAKVYANSQFYLFIMLTIGLWLSLKSNIFKREIPKIMACSFFMYALHQPILIPLVSRITKIIIRNSTILGYQFILIKIISVFAIFIISWLIFITLKNVLPQKIFFTLSGGRE